MSKVVFLNTSIATSDGFYSLTTVDMEMVKGIISSHHADGGEFLSAIGHESTSKIMSDLLGMEIPVNRIQYQQARGDIAIVFKLHGRPPEGKILTVEEIEEIGYTWKVMEKDVLP